MVKYGLVVATLTLASLDPLCIRLTTNDDAAIIPFAIIRHNAILKFFFQMKTQSLYIEYWITDICPRQAKTKMSAVICFDLFQQTYYGVISVYV